MATFQVISRVAPSAAPPKPGRRRLPQEWSAFIRVIRSMSISALLFVVVLNLSHSNYTFILLPALLSLFIAGTHGYTLNRIINSTPLYLLLTLCFAVVYYGFITVGILLTHFEANVPYIILITTALAWAVIFEPARGYIQSRIEQRFNVRDREARKAVEAFTATLREEIDLDQLSERFLNVIQQTLQPYSVSLWVRTTPQQERAAAIEPENAARSIADDDALVAYVLHSPRTAEIYRLSLDSPLLDDLRQQGAEMILPLASQGDLIGLLVLGPRLNGEEYSREDHLLLDTLATQVAPALRVAQMVQQQQAEVRERERIEQELRTAQAIQRAFLPTNVPALPGWRLVPYYQPAREVGGDFYDFHTFEDGRIGLVIGDVTGKGVPAALLMATVHTMLRAAVQVTVSPAATLARVNALLSTEIPTGMFITCFYALLDPNSGRLRYANAGHEPPYRQQAGSATELWATGMPLGLMPDTSYEEREATLSPGENLLFYSDGLVEAHNAGREMFGFPRLQRSLAAHANGTSLIDFLLGELRSFTGEGWEQEDDVTLLMLQRTLETFRQGLGDHERASQR
jgi:serine phosphatase RsbU (regulator of sigma subunit)